MRYFTVMLVLVTASLYTKSAAIAAPPPQLPCQKISILGKSHRLCWTFDDHPSKYTPSILKILRKHNIRATFFVVGWPLRYYVRYPKAKNAQLYLKWFKEIVKDRHGIGNHTVTHANLCLSSKRRIRWELRDTQRYVKRFGNVTPTLWRAPLLAFCRNARREARRLKLTHVSCHVQDYRRSPRRMWLRLRRRVLRGKKYSIILMHASSQKLRQFLRLIKHHP